MRKWFVLAGMACMVIAEPSFAESANADDDEYEEVVVRRKKKRPAKPEAPATATVAPTAPVIVPAAPIAVPAAVVVPAVVAIPQAVPATPAAPAVEEKPEEPPPPPEPPAADAAEPRRLVRYFCKAWKDKDYERLWWAMSSDYRDKVSLAKFRKLFVSDAEANGGLLDENILETAKTKDGNEGVKVELIFKFPRAQHRFVMAIAERQSGGQFRLVDSPIIPIDLDDI